MIIVKSLIRIIRPVNVVLSFLTMYVAAAVAGSLEPALNVLMAALTAALITVGANVINDIFDIEIDKINKPSRPLASGAISLTGAGSLFIASYLAALVCAYFLGWAMFVIALVMSVLLFFYSSHLKRTAIWGNLTVSFATAMAFIYAGMAVDRTEGAWIPAAFAFVFHFGREMLKDLEDVEGDSHGGALTFAVRYGKEPTVRVIIVTFILLIVFTIIPYILHIYGIYYLLTVAIGVWPVLIYVIMSARKDSGSVNLGKLSTVMKADMLIGLLAIYLG